MSVGLLIITHDEIGEALYEAATAVIGCSPLRTRILSVSFHDSPEQLDAIAQSIIEETDSGDGILILTDMYGATPSNIACKFTQYPVAVVAGINLPMLIRVLNYPTLNLQELTEKAISGGQDGVILCQTSQNQQNAATGN